MPAHQRWRGCLSWHVFSCVGGIRALSTNRFAPARTGFFKFAGSIGRQLPATISGMMHEKYVGYVVFGNGKLKITVSSRESKIL